MADSQESRTIYPNKGDKALESISHPAAQPELAHPIEEPSSPAPQIPPAVAAAVANAPAGSSVTLLPGPIGSTAPASAGNPPNPPQAYTAPVTAQKRVKYQTRAVHLARNIGSRIQPYCTSRNYKIAGTGIAAIAAVAALTIGGSMLYSRYTAQRQASKDRAEISGDSQTSESAQAQTQAQQAPAEKYLSGTLIDKLQTTSKTGLEKIILHGKSLFQGRNQYPKEDETEFVFYLESSTRRVIDENGKTELEPEEVIIPTRANNSEGKPATSIDLTTEGEYGLKIKNYEKTQTKGIMASVVKDDDISRKIELTTLTVKVAGKSSSYFIPAAEEPGKYSLPFYIIPALGAKRVIHPNGSVSIRSENGIYEPRIVSAKAYAKRAEAKIAPQAPIQVNHTTGRGSLR